MVIGALQLLEKMLMFFTSLIPDREKKEAGEMFVPNNRVAYFKIKT